jgi:drug/metabolite transporter (DMT)-like permease
LLTLLAPFLKKRSRYAIPGFVFFAQNNLSFIALQHMSNAAFQLLLNMRIVAVALLTVTVLRTPLNKVKWFAIVLLTNGAVQYQLSGCANEGGLKTSMEGLMVMVVIIACAAGGNIITQLVMQKSMDQPLMLQNSILYTWGVAMNGFNWFVSVRGAPADAKVEWFGDGFGRAAFGLCVFNAIYGLSISVILKRFGSLTRTFISTAAIVLNAILDTLFFGEKLTSIEMTTFLTIFASIFLFTIIGDDWGKMVKATSGVGESGGFSGENTREPNQKQDAESANLIIGGQQPRKD